MTVIQVLHVIVCLVYKESNTATELVPLFDPILKINVQYTCLKLTNYERKQIQVVHTRGKLD